MHFALFFFFGGGCGREFDSFCPLTHALPLVAVALNLPFQHPDVFFRHLLFFLFKQILLTFAISTLLGHKHTLPLLRI